MSLKKELEEKLLKAFEKDNTIFCSKKSVEETLGSNPAYLLDSFGITKSDLIRLERLGFAAKARYATRNRRAMFQDVNGKKIEITGTHYVRWILFQEVFNE